ncbi:hypothetical protein [Cellulomonas soli]
MTTGPSIPAASSACATSTATSLGSIGSSVASLHPYPNGSTTATVAHVDSSRVNGSKSSTGAAVPNPGSSTIVVGPAPVRSTCMV